MSEQTAYKQSEMTLREIDALVATKVMQWRVGEHPELHGTGQMMAEYEEPVYFKDDGSFICECDWNPTTEISDAWEVMEKFPLFRVERVEIFEGFPSTRATCWTVVEEDPAEVESHESPLAISIAALRAVGVEIDD